jgi:hypothetical protein
MLVLTASCRTQGEHPGDFTFAVPGELVCLSPTCPADQDDADGES